MMTGLGWRAFWHISTKGLWSGGGPHARRSVTGGESREEGSGRAVKRERERREV